MLALGLAACGSEDEPQANFDNPSQYFAPADSDNSAEAQLRRSFKTETGMYLLFNDTLQHRLLGTDINGDTRYFTETIDFGYDIGQGSTVSTTYTFDYLADIEQKQQMALFIKQYVLTRVTGKMRPYAIFLARNIDGYNTDRNMALSPYVVSNQRCLGVAMNYLLIRDRRESQKQSFADMVVGEIVRQQTFNNIDAFAQFLSYSADYYGQSISTLGIAKTREAFLTIGFISNPKDQTPVQRVDLAGYITEILNNTEAELQEKYGAYPVVMAKIAEARRVIAELGYKFE